MGKEGKAKNIQCYVREVYRGEGYEHTPRLLYASRITTEASEHPRMMHCHQDFLELFLICEGTAPFLIDYKKYLVQAGDLVIYNSGIIHDEATSMETPISGYCIAIGGVRMPDLKPNTILPSDMPPVLATGTLFDAFRNVFSTMYDALYHDYPQSGVLCHHLTQTALTLADNLMMKQSADEVFLEEPNILGMRVKQFIDAHYAEPITLHDIATHLNASSFYLAHVFKEMTGYSPMQYLLKRRIGEAQTLLISTRMPLARISETVGYDTQSYFNAQFMKHVGMTPKKYRDLYVVSHDVASSR